MKKVLLFANTDWYLYNFRLPLAKKLRAEGYAVHFLSPPGAYTQKIEQEKFSWHPLIFDRRGMNPLSEVIAFYKLWDFYRKNKFIVVHHFTIKSVIYGSLAAKFARVPHIINSVTGLGHVFISEGRRAAVLKFFVEIFYRLALSKTQIIFQNIDDQNYFVQHGLIDKNDSTLIKSSGVDIDQFKPTPEPSDTPVVLLGARLIWEKGVGEFVQAAQLVNESTPRARFVLVGDIDDGNPSSIPQAQLESWVDEGVIEWWGWREDMAAVYHQSNIVCLPSYREGVPKSLLEASACGRPLVATDVPGCREIVRHQVNGLLVPVHNAQALSEAISTLLSSAEMRRTYGKQGRKIVEQEFSITYVNEKTLTVYRKREND